MSVTIATLRTAYPEFTNCPDAVLNAAISNATLRCDEDVLQSHYDLAITLLACHFAAISPYGVDLRLQSQGSKSSPTSTPYYEMWEKLARAAGSAYRII